MIKGVVQRNDKIIVFKKEIIKKQTIEGRLNELENNGLLNQRTIFQKNLEQTIKIFFFKHKGKHGAIPKTIPPTNLLVSILRAPQLDVKKMKKKLSNKLLKKDCN